MKRAALGAAALLAGCMAGSGREARVASHFGARRSCPTNWHGILSALREDEGMRYVQTTAPISPGSSGGGLFDARGNLVGVTTLVFVGKERLNQSLNFAIAGEMFWSP